MASGTFFGIAELVWQSNRALPAANPFYIFETNITLDGPRTRVHRGGFANREAAQAYIEAKCKEMGIET